LPWKSPKIFRERKSLTPRNHPRFKKKCGGKRRRQNHERRKPWRKEGDGYQSRPLPAGRVGLRGGSTKETKRGQGKKGTSAKQRNCGRGNWDGSLSRKRRGGPPKKKKERHSGQVGANMGNRREMGKYPVPGRRTPWREVRGKKKKVPPCTSDHTPTGKLKNCVCRDKTPAIVGGLIKGAKRKKETRRKKERMKGST